MEIKDLGGLSEPASALINRCSDAIGAFAHPYQLVRIAKAEGKAAVIKAHSEAEIERAKIETEKVRALGDIEVTEVQQRGLQRLAIQEGRKQANIESILGKALAELKEGAKPEEIDEDWLTNFFEKCSTTSNKEIQELWARVLAGEANQPGKYSKRAVNVIQQMSKEDAHHFQALCRFCINVEYKDEFELAPLVYDLNVDRIKLYSENDVDILTLHDLESVGLIRVDAGIMHVRTFASDTCRFNYFDESYSVEFSDKDRKRTENGLPVGRVIFTKVGAEVASLCKPTPVQGFSAYLTENMKKYFEPCHFRDGIIKRLK